MPKLERLAAEDFAAINAAAETLSEVCDGLQKRAERFYDETPEGAPLETISALNRAASSALRLNGMLIARRQMAEHTEGVKRRIHEEGTGHGS